MRISDQIDDPDFDPVTNTGRGEWSLRDVSSGGVVLRRDAQGRGEPKPSCIDHGAMNAVNPARTLWRCLSCGRACVAHHVR